MKLLVAGRVITDPPKVGGGGESEIFEIGPDIAAKIYDAKLRSTTRSNKVLALCSSFDTFSRQHATMLVAFPQEPVYEGAERFGDLAGFSMALLPFPTLSSVGFDIERGEFEDSGGFRFDSHTAIDYVFALCGLVDAFHRARIVLGDVNPDNFLCDTKTARPAVVDIDAAQIGSMSCMATHPLYNDPTLEGRGRRIDGGYLVVAA